MVVYPSFLDAMVGRSGVHLTISMYRKKTHTDRYIHFNSNHHNEVKRGVIKCLKTRASRICEKGELEAERHLLDAFRRIRFSILCRCVQSTVFGALSIMAIVI